MSYPPSVCNIRGQTIATHMCKQNQDSTSKASLGQKSLPQANQGYINVVKHKVIKQI